jgi:hypothetical protein
MAAFEHEHPGHRFGLLHAWHNGKHWMATAQIDTRFIQVAHGGDPEAAMVAAMAAVIEAFDDPAERPSTGKPKSKWDDDGY